MTIQYNFFLKNLRENRVKFPEERNAFVLDIQHGRRDVTSKLAISLRLVCKMHTEKFCSFPDSFLGNSNFFKTRNKDLYFPALIAKTSLI